MKITRFQDQEIHPNPHGVDVRKLYDKESAQVSLITLLPGEGLKPHKTPVDVFLLCSKEHLSFRLARKKKFAKRTI